MQRILMLGLTLTLAMTAACGSKDEGGYVDDAKEGAGGGAAAKKDDPSGGDTTSPRTIPSGKPGVPDIQILAVHKTGTGEKCGTGKVASLKYKAMLADGRVIDPGARPFTFPVGQRRAIEGWDIVVAQMRVGDSWTVRIPSALAYGPRGRAPVPPNADMKFDMELLSFR